MPTETGPTTRPTLSSPPLSCVFKQIAYEWKKHETVGGPLTQSILPADCPDTCTTDSNTPHTAEITTTPTELHAGCDPKVHLSPRLTLRSGPVPTSLGEDNLQALKLCSPAVVYKAFQSEELGCIQMGLKHMKRGRKATVATGDYMLMAIDRVI